MPITKAQARTEVRSEIDDASGKRWGDLELDRLIGRTIDELWSDLLDVAPRLTSQLQTITPTSPGFLDLRLASQGGHLTQRFFRIHSIVRNGQTYSEATEKHVVIEDNAVIAAPAGYRYVIFGDQVWLTPLEMTEVELRYSFIPTTFTALTDGSNVPWPDGFESAFIFEAAARALTKGDVESMEQKEKLAGRAWTRLLAAIRRQRLGPGVPNVSQYTAVEAGGI